MHHTVNEIPSDTKKKYNWQKITLKICPDLIEPISLTKYQKKINLRIMKPGKIETITITLIYLFFNLYADDKILSAPIINLENLEPSYENP